MPDSVVAAEPSTNVPAVARSQYFGDSNPGTRPSPPTTGPASPSGAPGGTGSSGSTVTGTGPASTSAKGTGSAPAFHSPTPSACDSLSTVPAMVVTPPSRAYAAGCSRSTAATSVRGARATTCRPGWRRASRAMSSAAGVRTGVSSPAAPSRGSPLFISAPAPHSGGNITPSSPRGVVPQATGGGAVSSAWKKSPSSPVPRQSSSPVCGTVTATTRTRG